MSISGKPALGDCFRIVGFESTKVGLSVPYCELFAGRYRYEKPAGETEKHPQTSCPSARNFLLTKSEPAWPAFPACDTSVSMVHPHLSRTPIPSVIPLRRQMPIRDLTPLLTNQFGECLI